MNNKFSAYLITDREHPCAHLSSGLGSKSERQRIYKFPNGYGASVVQASWAYGGHELAVLHNDSICYDTPITDDVIGHLTPETELEHLEAIFNLPRSDT